MLNNLRYKYKLCMIYKGCTVDEKSTGEPRIAIPINNSFFLPTLQ